MSPKISHSSSSSFVEDRASSIFFINSPRGMTIVELARGSSSSNAGPTNPSAVTICKISSNACFR